MKQTALLLSFLLLFSFTAQAAEPSRQQLLKDLENAGSDTARINALNALGRDHIIQSEYVAADSLLELALASAREKGFVAGEMKVLINIGVLYWYQDKYPDALDYYLKALHLAEQSDNKNNIGRCYANIGLVYSSQGDRKSVV